MKEPSVVVSSLPNNQAKRGGDHHLFISYYSHRASGRHLQGVCTESLSDSVLAVMSLPSLLEICAVSSYKFIMGGPDTELQTPCMDIEGALYIRMYTAHIKLKKSIFKDLPLVVAADGRILSKSVAV